MNRPSPVSKKQSKAETQLIQTLLFYSFILSSVTDLSFTHLLPLQSRHGIS